MFDRLVGLSLNGRTCIVVGSALLRAVVLFLLFCALTCCAVLCCSVLCSGVLCFDVQASVSVASGPTGPQQFKQPP